MTSPLSPEAVAQMVADREDVFLIMKRDLYYRPNAQGYTGIKEYAGRYTLEQVAAMFPNMDSPHQDGTEFIRECDAPEYTKACYHDLKEAHQAQRLTTIAAENATLRASEAAALDRVKVLEKALRRASDRMRLATGLEFGEHQIKTMEAWAKEARALTPNADKE